MRPFASPKHPVKAPVPTFVVLFVFASLLRANEPLRLTNGRIFENWTVLGQTNSQITIKYDGGAAKVDKKLLPPALLAKYPVVAEKFADIVPEPAGVQRKSNAERHIEVVDQAGEVTRWSLSAGELPSMMKFSKYRQTDRTAAPKMEASFLLNVRDLGPLLSVLEKVDRWTEQARKSAPADFEKPLGKVGDDDWNYAWKQDGSVTIFTGEAFLHDKDVESVAALVGAIPIVFAEKVKEMRAAVEFSRTLK